MIDDFVARSGPWDDEDDRFMGTVENLNNAQITVRIVSSVDGRWADSQADKGAYTSAGAYHGASWLSSIYAEQDSEHPLYALTEIDGEPVGLRETMDKNGATYFSVIAASDVPAQAWIPPVEVGAFEKVVKNELAIDRLDVPTSSLTLSVLADALLNGHCPAAEVGRTILSAPRRQSGYSFGGYGALAGAGDLARIESAQAVRDVRRELETCVEFFAERWGMLVHLPVNGAFEATPDPSPTAGEGHTYPAAAHTIGDWLELAVAELAEGRGNLVIMGRRIAEDTAWVEREDGTAPLANPIAEDQWYVWAFDQGALWRYRLRSRPGAPVASED